MMRVYRVQDRYGRGPFKPGFSKFWADENFAEGVKAFPTYMDEFGHDLIDRRGKRGEWFGSAVRSVDKLCEWFSTSERTKLKEFGYHIVCLKILRVLAESENQLVFARTTPLNRNVIYMPWP